MTETRSPDGLGHLYRNTGILIAGTIAASILGLSSNILAARRLGPSDFGFLVLLSTYAFFVIGGLVGFQPWLALIHYGTRAITEDNEDRLKRLLKFGFLLDIGAGGAGALIGTVSLLLYARLSGWKGPFVAIAALYGASLLFRLTGTSAAVFRLFDRFDLQAGQQAAAAAIRLLFIGGAYLGGSGLRGFLLFWLASEVLGTLLTPLLAFRELRRRGIRGVFRSRLTGIRSEFPGLLRFLITTNLQTTLKTGVREFDIMLVGALLGNSAAGLYKIARQFARVIGRVEDAMRQAIYPDLSRHWARRDARRFRSLQRKPALLMGGLGAAAWAGFALFGKPVLGLTVGPSFSAAYGVTLVFLLGTILSMATFHFQSTLLAMGRPGDIFRTMLGAAAVYFPLLAAGIHWGALLGAAAAYVVFEALLALRLGSLIRRRLPVPGDAGPRTAEIIETSTF